MKAEDVIHRDLKPENVLVKWKGNEIRFKVADFGLAKIMDKQKDRLTGMDKRYTNGTVCGTPAYMAPEVLLGHPYGHKADQFSVGLMIYECYTGRLPFEVTILVMQIQLVYVPVHISSLTVAATTVSHMLIFCVLMH